MNLPPLRPAIGTALLLTIVATWNDFFLPLAALRDLDLLPATVGVYNGQALSNAAAGGEQVWNLIVTGSFISVVPLVAAFLSPPGVLAGRVVARQRAVRRTTQDDRSRIQELTVSMP